jgi:hypothetical protein
MRKNRPVQSGRAIMKLDVSFKLDRRLPIAGKRQLTAIRFAPIPVSWHNPRRTYVKSQ